MENRLKGNENGQEKQTRDKVGGTGERTDKKRHRWGLNGYRKRQWYGMERYGWGLTEEGDRWNVRQM